MEFDGHLSFSMELTAERATAVNDLRLEIPLRADVARYLMGMGRPGGLRPAEHTWHWDRKNNQDSYFAGPVPDGKEETHGQLFLVAICLNYAVRLSQASLRMKTLAQELALLRARVDDLEGGGAGGAS